MPFASPDGFTVEVKAPHRQYKHLHLTIRLQSAWHRLDQHRGQADHGQLRLNTVSTLRSRSAPRMGRQRRQMITLAGTQIMPPVPLVPR